MSENDFTELVIAQAHSSTDIAKSSLQALFSKHSQSSTTSKALPLSDLCFSLVRQIDVMKQSSKFLLKQLLMDSSSSNRKNILLRRHIENMQNEVTQIKQQHSAQRLQFEQIQSELQQKLAAREATNRELNEKIKTQQKMIKQFQQFHNDRSLHTSSPRISTHDRMSHSIPLSTGNESIHTDINSHGGSSNGIYHQLQRNHDNKSFEPPLKGFMRQKEAKKIADQQAYNNLLRNPGATLKSRRVSNGSSATKTYSQQIQNHYTTRPYTGTSTDSHSSSAPRIRELSSTTGFNFTGSSTSSTHHHNRHINKRRKPSTPNSSSSYYSMTPKTAFTLNHGPNSIGNFRRR